MASSGSLSTVNQLLGENIPSDIRLILEKSGFDTILSLQNIKESDITDIEAYVNTDLSILRETTYKNEARFKFRPGHKTFLVALPHRINVSLEKKQQSELSQQSEVSTECEKYTYVFRDLLSVANQNSGRAPNGVRYSVCSRGFSTQFYINAGKKSYETLAANMPMPAASTVCK